MRIKRPFQVTAVALADNEAVRTSLAGLADLYGAWCRRVPFDNIRKLIHVRADNPAALPGDAPNAFFEAWLAHGTGATWRDLCIQPLP